MDATSTTDTPRVPAAHILRRVAVLADVDPRSAGRYFRGEPLRESVRERVQRAVANLRSRGKLPGDATDGRDRSTR